MGSVTGPGRRRAGSILDIETQRLATRSSYAQSRSQRRPALVQRSTATNDTLRARESTPKTSKPRARHRGRRRAGKGARRPRVVRPVIGLRKRVRPGETTRAVPNVGRGRQQLLCLRCEEPPDTRQPGVGGRWQGCLHEMAMAARIRRASSVPGRLTAAARMGRVRGAAM